MPRLVSLTFCTNTTWNEFVIHMLYKYHLKRAMTTNDDHSKSLKREARKCSAVCLSILIRQNCNARYFHAYTTVDRFQRKRLQNLYNKGMKNAYARFEFWAEKECEKLTFQLFFLCSKNLEFRENPGKNSQQHFFHLSDYYISLSFLVLIIHTQQH